jgi:hypothetical protein
VEEGREKVMREHTWDVRVDQLIQQLPAFFGNIYAKTSFQS